MGTSILSKAPLLTPHSRSPRRRPTFFFVAVVAGFIALAYLLFSIGPCVSGPHCYNGYYSRFSFDAGRDAGHPAWMADIADDTPLTSLSIPGTHDTMTHAIGKESLQCQNWNLTAQLAGGLRYFDIRARLRDDELHIYHGNGYTGYSFADVLLVTFAFLDAHPSEAVVMRLKDEGPPIGRNTRSFEEAFNYYRTDSPLTTAGARRHLTTYDGAGPIPDLGALRSKIFLLQEFDAKGGPYGLLWDGPQMALEDLWIIPDIYHLADKWTAIRTALERASTAPLDDGLLYLAHVSASIGVLPIEAAAGPYNRTVAGMNDMTGQWIEDFEHNEGSRRTGIVILDFPGKRLVEAILRWNRPLYKSV